MPYPVKGLLEVYEDMVEILLMLQVFLAEDPEIEYLFCGAPSGSETCLLFCNDLFCLWLESGSGVRLNDGPDIKLFILVGFGRSIFVCCLAHRGSTVGFLLLQCSSGVVRHPRDLQVSVATCFCRVLIFALS